MENTEEYTQFEFKIVSKGNKKRLKCKGLGDKKILKDRTKVAKLNSKRRHDKKKRFEKYRNLVLAEEKRAQEEEQNKCFIRQCKESYTQMEMKI